MKAKILRKPKNVGSKATPAQAKGTSVDSLKTKGRPSFEGYQSGSRADIVSRDNGYMSKRNQLARLSNNSLSGMTSSTSPGIISGASEKLSRMYHIGNKNTGSAGILSARRELNGL